MPLCLTAAAVHPFLLVGNMSPACHCHAAAGDELMKGDTGVLETGLVKVALMLSKNMTDEEAKMDVDDIAEQQALPPFSISHVAMVFRMVGEGLLRVNNTGACA